MQQEPNFIAAAVIATLNNNGKNLIQESNEIEAAVIAITTLFLILGGFIVMIMVVYRRRRNKHIIEKINIESNFRQELLKTQIEVQEQTLINISREIHDNINQVLSFVKLNLGLTGRLEEPHKQQKVNESRELVAQAINDLRNLSKSLSFEQIAALGLVKTIEIEVQRINNSGLIGISLLLEGEGYPLGEQRELVLFRICQEAVNNTLKHANAKHINISLRYSATMFNLTLEDNGDGLPAATAQGKSGAGLQNMQSRAALIGAVATFNAAAGKGFTVDVTLPHSKQQINADGSYSNSPG